MPDHDRTELRLYERAIRQGWDVPTEVRAEVIRTLAAIVRDETARRRDRTSAARALLQATRVDLDAIRVAQGSQYEELARRLEALEEGGVGGGELAGGASGD